MTTYYFDITMQGRRSADVIGSAFASVTEAQAEARKIVAELLFDELPEFNLGEGFFLRIVSEAGDRIEYISVRYDLGTQH